ncbi:MAG: YjbQ family protein [Thermoplasmata archaeon]|nr:YjbQ family protein [Thermoplasmata archaeon]
MAVYSETLELERTVEGDVVDITPRVADVVSRSGIKEGMVLVFVPGSTGALTTVEYEPGLVEEDIPRLLERVAPRNAGYGHERRWHDGNGHSHIRASLLGPDITVPVSDGRLVLGTWQQVVFLELDVKPRRRSLAVKVMGE